MKPTNGTIGAGGVEIETYNCSTRVRVVNTSSEYEVYMVGCSLIMDTFIVMRKK